RRVLSEEVRGDFERISKMSRDLVSSLYETVWAVDPENDNLESLGSFICETASQLCGAAELRCALERMDLPRDVQISSHVRHSVVMAVKEGIHNVIKHANATEVTVRVEFKNSVLTISIRDNGRGFQTSDLGNGLPNMRRRLVDIGGVCLVESSATDGTTVQMRLSIPTLGPASRKTLFYRARKPGPFPTN
ncbi:MAG TPA: ATP-binding protein, partial [Chthoniobacteraceae bacterium]